VHTAIATGGLSLPVAARRILWTGGLRPLVDTAATRLVPRAKHAYHTRKWSERLPRWLCPDRLLRDELIANLVARRIPGLTPEGRVPFSYYRHSLRSTGNPYLYYEFETAFHIEAACGLRLLSPYHDRDLVRLANRIGPRTLVRGNRYKGLLRPVVAKHLPKLGFEKQRKDYPREGHRRELLDLRASLERTWRSQRFEMLGQLGLVDSATVAEELTRTSSYPYGDLIRMFALMSAEHWVRAHAVTL
jgi:hypothetical protein